MRCPGLFTTQIGYSHGRELGAAAAAQMEQLAYYPNWAATNPATLALTERILALAPPQMSRIFFTSGGSESVESAWKLARQHFQARGESSRRIVISRNGSYHGCSLGALSITGIPAAKAPFEPLHRRTRATSSTPTRARTRAAIRSPPPTRSRRRSSPPAPRTSAWSSSSRCRTPAACLVPPPGYAQRVREICDRHGVLLCCDEVICAFGRLGHWFGSERLGFTPDLITFAKGVTSGYAPLGGVIFTEAVAAPLLEAEGLYAHGYTFGGHPVSCATALANIAVMERLDVLANVLEVEPYLESVLNEVAAASPIAVEARGCGFFRSLEIVENGARRPRARGHARPRRDRAHRRARQPLSRHLAAADQRPVARRRARARHSRAGWPRSPGDRAVPARARRPRAVRAGPPGRDRPARARPRRADRQAGLERGAVGPRSGGRGRDRQRRARRQPLPRRRLLGAAQRARRAPRRRLRARSSSATAPTACSTTSRSRCSSRATRSRSAGRRSRSTRSTPPRWARSPCGRRSPARATTSTRSPRCVDRAHEARLRHEPEQPDRRHGQARGARALPRRPAGPRPARARRGLLRVRRRSRVPGRRERAARARSPLRRPAHVLEDLRARGLPRRLRALPAGCRRRLPQGQERVRRDAVGARRRAREPRCAARRSRAAARRRARGASASPRVCASAASSRSRASPTSSASNVGDGAAFAARLERQGVIVRPLGAVRRSGLGAHQRRLAARS